MYFALEYLGIENVDRLKEIHSQSEKWRFIHNFAYESGFKGIQFYPAYENEFGLSFQSIPEYIRKSFRLTYHTGNTGISRIITPDEIEKTDLVFSKSLQTASFIGAEDVSFHPPLVTDIALLPVAPDRVSTPDSNKTKNQLRTLIKKWLPKFQACNITLSLETHMTPYVFIFSGLQDFHEFMLTVPGLGILIDVSHNYYDGYDITHVLQTLNPYKITGFHLSDAIRGKVLAEGTHLPIGQGQVDFARVLAQFGSNNLVYGALEVRGTAKGIADSLTRLRKIL
jgi:sugar phosphate isomerase/epimerase